MTTVGDDEDLERLGDAVDDAMSPVVDEQWRPILPVVRAELDEREKAVRRPSPDEIIAKMRANGL